MNAWQFKLKILIFFSMVLGMVSCASDYKSTDTLSKGAYESELSKKGVVLVAVNWSRKWRCGNFENAELRNIGFDLLSAKFMSDEDQPSLVVNGPPRLMTKPTFVNYAFLLEPGEYAISYLRIKVAEANLKVGYFTGKRSKFIEGGQAKGGSFHVKAGEVVYIGNFWIDCAYGPTLWRYYSEGKEGFKKHLQEFSDEFPYLDLQNAQYRLFKTTEFGYDYSLE